ncbi:MAG: ABC transporter substrate-binding protein [Lautropia sp.]
MKQSGRTRRGVLRAAGTIGAAASIGLFAGRALAQPKKVVLAWSQSSYCHSPIPVAFEQGYFEKNGLEVETLNWGGAADQLLEALATNKADFGVGLIHRWLKPLETGFDVKIVGSVHGGCLRLVGVQSAGIRADEDLAGKIVGVGDLNSPAKNFFDIHLAKKGVKNVEFRVYPADLLDQAAKKGEIHAIADGDPNLYLLEKRNPGAFVEIGNSGTGIYADKICCVVGASGKLVREDRRSATALVRALAQASDFVVENPAETARLYAKYTPKVSEDELRQLIHTTNYKHHPAGGKLRDEVEYFAKDFHVAGILKKATDPARFANHIALDVLA